MRIAFTGFGPFLDVPENPTATLIEALRGSGDPALADCSFEVLDVRYETVGQALDRILAQGPGALVMTGFARSAAGLRLESVATDTRGPSADAAGFVPGTAEGAITRLACPHVGFASLRAVLADSGIPVEVSQDAGQYVCNHTLYTALTRLAGAEPAIPAPFVHIPAITETPLAEASTGSLPLADMVRAMTLIARALLP